MTLPLPPHDPAAALLQAERLLSSEPSVAHNLSLSLQRLGRGRDDVPLLCQALLVGARALLMLSRPAEALGHFLEVVALSAPQDSAVQARAWQGAASAKQDLGEDNDAQDYLGQALIQAREAGQLALELDLLDQLAGLHSELGDHQQALGCLEANLRLRRDLGDDLGIAATTLRVCLAQMALAELAPAQARLLWTRAGNGLEDVLSAASDRDPKLWRQALWTRARLRLACQDWPGAEADARAAGLALEAAGERRRSALALGDLAQAQLRQGAAAAATEALHRALVALERVGTRADRAALHLHLSQAYRLGGDYAQALHHFELYHDQDAELRIERNQRRAQTTFARLDVARNRRQSELHTRRGVMLEGLVAERNAQLQATQVEMADLLASAAEYRDAPLGPHTRWVGEASARLATELGWADEEAAHLAIAARLHDIGKLAIPDAILLKDSQLTHEEWAVMRTHTTLGARLLSHSTSPLLRLASEIALSHHEHWNGSGYPGGLSSHAIPETGRIVSVVDSYDALVSERPYKLAWTPEDALLFIQSQSGQQFDPGVVEAFSALHRRGELPPPEQEDYPHAPEDREPALDDVVTAPSAVRSLQPFQSLTAELPSD